MTKEERIAALLGKNKRFKQTDAKWLSALPEEHLAALEAEQPEPATTPAPEVKPEPKPETPTTPETLSAKPQTVADYIANAPAEVADILRSAVATQNAVKATTIKALKDTGRCDLTDAELQAMPIGQLRSLAKMANVATTEAPTDFSLNIPPRVADSGDESIPAPASMVDAFRAAKK